jgi:hypothetical protein
MSLKAARTPKHKEQIQKRTRELEQKETRSRTQTQREEWENSRKHIQACTMEI